MNSVSIDSSFNIISCMLQRPYTTHSLEKAGFKWKYLKTHPARNGENMKLESNA